MLKAELGDGVESVWFPRGSWEEVEFYGTLTCLRLHVEGREAWILNVGNNGFCMIVALLDRIIQYLDCRRLSELQQQSYKALEAGSTMAEVNDFLRWLLTNPFWPLPAAR